MARSRDETDSKRQGRPQGRRPPVGEWSGRRRAPTLGFARALPPTSYRLQLAGAAELVVWFLTERGKVISYSVVLLALHEDAWHAVRVHDNAHGANEMHRCTLAGGKAEPQAPQKRNPSRL